MNITLEKICSSFKRGSTALAEGICIFVSGTIILGIVSGAGYVCIEGIRRVGVNVLGDSSYLIGCVEKVQEKNGLADDGIATWPVFWQEIYLNGREDPIFNYENKCSPQIKNCYRFEIKNTYPSLVLCESRVQKCEKL